MKEAFKWVVGRLRHKLHHFHPSKLMDILTEHGIALLVIIILWEIIEDIMFPLLFIWLGHNVNPWVITGAPISWLLCLHPIAVPVMWAIWIRISGRKDAKSIQD